MCDGQSMLHDARDLILFGAESKFGEKATNRYIQVTHVDSSYKCVFSCLLKIVIFVEFARFQFLGEMENNTKEGESTCWEPTFQRGSVHN